jgi:hypothetical protein
VDAIAFLLLSTEESATRDKDVEPVIYYAHKGPHTNKANNDGVMASTQDEQVHYKVRLALVVRVWLPVWHAMVCAIFV